MMTTERQPALFGAVVDLGRELKRLWELSTVHQEQGIAAVRDENLPADRIFGLADDHAIDLIHAIQRLIAARPANCPADALAQAIQCHHFVDGLDTLAIGALPEIHQPMQRRALRMLLSIIRVLETESGIDRAEVGAVQYINPAWPASVELLFEPPLVYDVEKKVAAA